jgi:hypothetical protein
VVTARLHLPRCDRRSLQHHPRLWSGWRRSLQMVQPDTNLRWHRRLSPDIGQENRPTFPEGLRWGELSGSNWEHAPRHRIVGYTPHSRRTAEVVDRGSASGSDQESGQQLKPSSRPRRTFLTNHLAQTAAQSHTVDRTPRWRGAERSIRSWNQPGALLYATALLACRGGALVEERCRETHSQCALGCQPAVVAPASYLCQCTCGQNDPRGDLLRFLIDHFVPAEAVIRLVEWHVR